jgi:hypothetical protein
MTKGTDKDTNLEILVNAFYKSANNIDDIKSRIMESFDFFNEINGKQYYVPLFNLRESLSDVSREDFDEAINDLRRDWILTLSPAEGLHEKIPEHILNAGIIEQSNNLVYAARRATYDDEED